MDIFDCRVQDYDFNSTDLVFNGLKLIKPVIHNDDRGYFFEKFNYKNLSEIINVDNDFLPKINWVQENVSFSHKNVIRGLHFQTKHAQAKLISCISGAIQDIVVDLRNDSQTFGKWFSVILDSTECSMLFIPSGFAHGFCCLSKEGAHINYMCSDYWHSEYESGIAWNDKTLNINWLEAFDADKNALKHIISLKDSNWPSFDKKKKYFSSSGFWLGE